VHKKCNKLIFGHDARHIHGFTAYCLTVRGKCYSRYSVSLRIFRIIEYVNVPGLQVAYRLDSCSLLPIAKLLIHKQGIHLRSRQLISL